MSKILIHSIAFSPDGVSTAYLYNDIALKYKEKGYEVVVLTTTPHYNIVKTELKKQPLKRRLLGLYFISDYKGITVKHIPQKKFKSSALRMFGFLFWHFESLILGLFEKKVDVILSPSPPLSIGLINIILGKLKRAKVIYNVQEIYPDLLIENGLVKSRIIISGLRKLERFVYNHSDIVTTIDKVFHETIVDRMINSSKLYIIPNFVDTFVYKPLTVDNNVIDVNLFPSSSSLKLMYAGNIGYAQDWKIFIEIAKKLKNKNIDFFVIGDGVMKKYIENEKNVNNLKRVYIIPYQPRNLIPNIIAYSDIQFIFMTPETEGKGFPSKVYTIMACGKPILVCSGKDTPIINFLKNKGCALLITEKSKKQKTEKVVKLLKSIDRKQLEVMGKQGVDIIHQKYSKSIVTDLYVNLTDKLL